MANEGVQWEHNSYAWMERQVDCHWQIIDTTRHLNESLTMKTTTNTGKNQKINRKVQDENVEVI